MAHAVAKMVHALSRNYYGPCLNPHELWLSSPSLLGTAKFRSAAIVLIVSIRVENKAIFSRQI